MCIVHSVRRRRLRPPLSRRYAYSPRACPASRRRIFMTSYRSFWISWGPDASSSPLPPVAERPYIIFRPRARPSRFSSFAAAAFRINFRGAHTTFAAHKVPGLMESFCALEVFGFFDNPISDVRRRTERENKKKRFRIVLLARCTCGKFKGAHNDILYIGCRAVRILLYPLSTPGTFIYSFIYFFFCRPRYSRNIVV